METKKKELLNIYLTSDRIDSSIDKLLELILTVAEKTANGLYYTTISGLPKFSEESRTDKTTE